ncbi:uncharacterized protein LOC134268335 [Saccostrea cucullata]|uniref:uncharacterized protein LOC134268335 n=1 Tax=Saccostrea cuccullata TaxID=36930 RepID=UPI002ED39016
MRRYIISIYCFLECIILRQNTIAQVHVTAAGQCLVADRHIVQILKPIGQKQCVRKCLQNRQCQSVNYKRQQLLCEIILAKYGDEGISLVTNAECDYIEMDSQEMGLGSVCISSSCDGECVLLSSGESFCNKQHYYVCPNNYIWIKEHLLCFSAHYTALSWQGAESYCQSLSNRTRLAVLDTWEKIQAVTENVNSYDFFWLGASFNLPGTPSYGKDSFYWNTGKQVDPTMISYHEEGQCLELDTWEDPVMIGSYICSEFNNPLCEFVL